VIKISETQVNQFLLGCKCPVSSVLPGRAMDLSAPLYMCAEGIEGFPEEVLATAVRRLAVTPSLIDICNVKLYKTCPLSRLDNNCSAAEAIKFHAEHNV
jgi:hypothetical protein